MISSRTVKAANGSGVIISSHHVLTCAHVVKGLDEVSVGGETVKVIDRVYEEEGLDIALLEMTTAKGFGDVGFLRHSPGKEFCAYGFPNPQGDWITGTLMGENLYGWWQLKVDGDDVHPGFSGECLE